ncbi:MAG: carboxypeptidase-like regulatory domain-containing protein [Ignavibacteriales bacterium]|nr:carboxypeptidase-like regulatory domain-containing protein [Ignavibacteriales bacterium]
MIKILAVSPEVSFGFQTAFLFLRRVRYENLNHSFYHIQTFHCLAQQITIKGKLVDAETNLPLANANIFISTKLGVGTFSDLNGEFNLTADIKDSDTLSASFVGYETGKISIEQMLKIPECSNYRRNCILYFLLEVKSNSFSDNSS